MGSFIDMMGVLCHGDRSILYGLRIGNERGKVLYDVIADEGSMMNVSPSKVY